MLKPSTDCPETIKQVNMKMPLIEKRALQVLANENTDGDVTAVIRMFIRNEAIKR